MKTLVSLDRERMGQAEYEADLPVIPEGTLMRVPDAAAVRVYRCCVDISVDGSPVQRVAVQ